MDGGSVGVDGADGAVKLGERLLADVGVEGLSELLASLRTLADPSGNYRVSGIPDLDALLAPPSPSPAADQPPRSRASQQVETPNLEPSVQQPLPTTTTRPTNVSPPSIIELISPPPTHHPTPSGKTSLVHLLTTHAILPSRLSNVPLSGLSRALILIDPLSHFSIPRLSQVLLAHIAQQFRLAGRPLDAEDASRKREIIDCIKASLSHVHIFRPSSWASLIATLEALPTYLFTRPPQHRSTHRQLHAIVLEDIHIFASQIRSSSYSTHRAAQPTPLQAASTALTSQLSHLTTLLSCTAILTSHSTTPSAFRPALPTAWPPALHTARLAVRRVEVVRFALGMCVEEAEAERGQRAEVVKRGRFEVWKIGGTGAGGGGGGGRVRDSNQGEGLVFRVGVGVEVEKGREEES